MKREGRGNRFYNRDMCLCMLANVCDMLESFVVVAVVKLDGFQIHDEEKSLDVFHECN